MQPHAWSKQLFHVHQCVNDNDVMQQLQIVHYDYESYSVQSCVKERHENMKQLFEMLQYMCVHGLYPVLCWINLHVQIQSFKQ